MTNHPPFFSLPEEMLLSIFKKLDWIDVFKMRRVSVKCKKTIDHNLKYFYVFFKKKYPECFLASLKEEVIFLKDFKLSFKMKYIINFNKDNYSSYFVKTLMDKPANTLKYAYDLHKEYNVPPFFAVEFIDCISCSGQYDNFINLKNAGFTNFFCKKISLDHTNKVGNEKVELICEFKKIGFNDFYAKEAGLRYSLEDLPMLCKIFKVCNKEHFSIEMYEVMNKMKPFLKINIKE